MATFQRLAASHEIPAGGSRCFVVGDRKIAVFHVNGEFFAIDDTCTHAQASLSAGDIVGNTVECPRHGAAFDVRTGEALSLPATKPVQTYPVRLEGDEILIAID